MKQPIKISSELLEEMIEYIEAFEVLYDGENGSNRELSELIADGDMPEIYNKLLKLKSIFNLKTK